jgi:hypothetical protein
LQEFSIVEGSNFYVLQTGRIPGAAAVGAVDSETRQGDHAFQSLLKAQKQILTKAMFIFYFIVIVEQFIQIRRR